MTTRGPAGDTLAQFRMSARPSRGLLLVTPVDATDTLPGGRILVPDAAKQRMTAWQCEVIAVGAAEACDDEECERQHLHDGEHTHGCPVEVGDWLLVRPRSFVDASVLGRELRLVRQSDVLAIVRQ